MTTNSQVQIEIVARDRASPVLSRVGRNMSLLQRSAGTVAAQMTGLGGAAGTAARSIGLLGLGLGPIGLAFTALGIEPVTESTEQFRKFIAADVAHSAELLKEAGFKPE